MNKYLNLAYWGRALTHPIVLLGLAVDLLPIVAVFLWGWQATPLVMLYWMENIIAGAMTIPRIIISGATYGGIGLASGLFMSVFFVFHYGLFCLVHGTFLMVFSAMGEVWAGGNADAMQAAPVMDVFGIFQFGLNSGLHVDWMIYAITAFQLIVFLWEFIIKGEWKDTNPMAEMFAPYGRIIVLHIGIFAGAAALFVLGQPMIGVLALIVLRAGYGIITNSKRAGIIMGDDFDKAMNSMGGRERFEKMLRGEKVDDV